MKTEIIISGFGGQGVLSMGKILAYSGLMENKEVTWMPAYGPEQRGGTANVTVIVSDERISSPILSKYDVVIALNQPSLDKFEPKLKTGGILIYDGYAFHKAYFISTISKFYSIFSYIKRFFQQSHFIFISRISTRSIFTFRI